MKRSLDAILKEIRSRRKNLLAGYDEHNLHQLRVSVRRLRGLLRFEESGEARQLRREWGYLISHTNAARDWDTLAGRVRALEPGELAANLLPALEAGHKRVVKGVIKRLAEDSWHDTTRRTKRYLKHRISEQRRPPADSETVSEAAHRVNHAWVHARTHDTSRAWHKLRIAIKDLRYSLDTFALEVESEHIAVCKALQDLMGQWHDTVVHQELLDTIEDTLGEGDAGAREAVAALRATLDLEGKQCLASARQLMESRGDPPFPPEVLL